MLAGTNFTEMCSGSETVAYLRLIDSCITQLKAQGPSRTCNESKEEEEAGTNRAEAHSLWRRETVLLGGLRGETVSLLEREPALTVRLNRLMHKS